MRMSLIVLAKAPRADHVKTRLCPPCSPEEAATLAHAALTDTMETVVAAAADVGARPVVALDGSPDLRLPWDVDVVPQRGRGLDERLVAAFADVGGPAFLVGMDTPQLTAETIVDAVRRLERDGVDAVLGEAVDGGWWAIGLRRPDARVFLGVPMSTAETYVAQRARLVELELRVERLPVLRDVDEIDDALAVAAEAPGTRFAAAVAELRLAALEDP
jgi:uncharacterized protein